MCKQRDTQQAVLFALHTTRERTEAARRAFVLANRLKPGPARVRHASRIFSNYNRLRRHLQLLQEANQ